MQIKWPDNLQFSFVHKDKCAGEREKTWQVLGRSKITLQKELKKRGIMRALGREVKGKKNKNFVFIMANQFSFEDNYM